MEIDSFKQFEKFLASHVPPKEAVFKNDAGIKRMGYFMKLLGNPQNKIKVIHNGVDTKKFQPAADKRKIKGELGFNPDDIAIVSVGRLYARKGLFTLIESMPPVIKKFP
ncbi:MAG TPA: hypothetical protein PLF86_02915, partial [Candidatus Moranbacteria bacterium]|nr:hypothetical protein [Candidatus Moranbacteria bacterium]